MTSFWSLWIIILTVITFIGIIWVLFGNRKTTSRGENQTTGHSYDGIEEYDNPLPAWWLNMFVITIVFGVGYLIVYPGLGNFKGIKGWTSSGQWDKQIEKADKRYGELFASYGEMTIDQLLASRPAIKMGQRIFANNCAQCHGSDAKGAYGIPNLTDADWLYGGTAQAIKTSITEGRTGSMPAWKSILDVETVERLSNVIMADNTREEKQLPSDKTFQQFCAACHGADAKGSQALGAPNLVDNVWLYGVDEGKLLYSLFEGRGGVMPTHKTMLSENKIHLLTAYVISLGDGVERQ